MSDGLPVSADFPAMGQGWPAHVCNVSGKSTMHQAPKPGWGKSGAPDGGTSHRGQVLNRNGNGPRPVPARRMWAGNAAEAAATTRSIRVITKGNQFAGGRGDGNG